MAGKTEEGMHNVRAAMEAAWRDHHHARDQTWKALQIEAVLGAGLVTVDAQFKVPLATLAAGLLVIAAAIFGILISLNHRRLERRKFIHIVNCEEELGLHSDDVIPLQQDFMSEIGVSKSDYDARAQRKVSRDLIRDAAVSIPGKLRCVDILRLQIQNTAVFILRMHFVIILYALLIMIFRVVTTLR